MSTMRRALGERGEVIARRYLEEQGYDILESNFRCSYGEIDIVAREGECLVFVEVKTRRSRSFGRPEESITPSKKEKMIEVAQAYLQAHDSPPDPWRIDVVAIEMGYPGSSPRIHLIRNAVS